MINPDGLQNLIISLNNDNTNLKNDNTLPGRPWSSNPFSIAKPQWHPDRPRYTHTFSKMRMLTFWPLSTNLFPNEPKMKTWSSMPTQKWERWPFDLFDNFKIIQNKLSEMTTLTPIFDLWPKSQNRLGNCYRRYVFSWGRHVCFYVFSLIILWSTFEKS